MISFETIARLRAIEQSQAQLIAGRRRVTVQPDARVVCALDMAGEVAAPHIIAWGRLGEPARVVCIAEPRNRDALAVLFHRALGWLPRYMEGCRDGVGLEWPQLIVPGRPTARLIALLADRLSYTRGDRRLRRIGRLLTYFAEREAESGQQALLTATGMLTTHWATGQVPGEDQHLGALLAWTDPPAGLSAVAAAATAEQEPMGVNTDPEFDRDVLAPLLAVYHDVRLRGGTRRALRNAGRPIREALLPVVLRQYDETQRAVALLLRAGLPPLPELGALGDQEREAFAWFMDQRDRGWHVSRRDRPKPAAIRLTGRMETAAQVEAAIQLGDPLAREQAIMAGRIVRGLARNPRRVRVAPRRFSSAFDVETTQPSPRPREGDTLVDLGEPRRRMRVIGLHRQGPLTILTLEIVRGQNVVGLPAVGAVVELAPRVAEWGEIVRRRVHVSRVLPMLPPTHDRRPLPAGGMRRSPADPLAAVEALA